MFLKGCSAAAVAAILRWTRSTAGATAPICALQAPHPTTGDDDALPDQPPAAARAAAHAPHDGREYARALRERSRDGEEEGAGEVRDLKRRREEEERRAEAEE